MGDPHVDDPDPSPAPSAFLPAATPSRAGTFWRDYGQWMLATSLILALAWLTYTGNGQVLVLSTADLGIHEAGHLFLSWGPRPLAAFAGTALQLLVPAALSVYFWRRRDRFAAVLTLAWLAENLNNISVYLYDATRMVLPLFGDLDGSGAGHDWRYLLGPEVFDALGATDAIALTVRALSVVVFASALWLALAPLVGPRINAWRDARATARLSARRETLPVREPRNRVELRSTETDAAAGVNGDEGSA